MITFGTIMQYASGILALVTLSLMVIKPLRERFLGASARSKAETEATKCMLRNAITEIYFAKRAIRSLHQFEYENLAFLYAVYKKLGGNSFIDRIWEEIQEWEVSP